MAESVRGGFVAACLALLLAARLAAATFDPADTTSWKMPHADLYDVDAQGGAVWAVGYWGTVMRSVDGGRSWAHVATSTDRTLYGVSFADPEHGWAVGSGGVVLGSADGGASWTPQQVEVTDEFGDVLPLETELFAVAAISPREAWAVGDFGVVIRTRDGEHWEQVRLPEGVFADENLPDRILNGVVFTDPQHGWIAGEFGTTLRTSDGGETWVGERRIEGAISDIYLFDVDADADGTGVAGGTGGVVLGTEDGGAAWQTRPVPTTAGVFGVAWSRGRGIAVGDRGVLLVTLDGGRSWFEPRRPLGFNWLRGATFGSADDAFVVGEAGLILRSSDGGNSWTPSAGRQPTPTGGISVPEPRSDLPGREEVPEDG